jgi:hypothetical protein
MTDKHHLPARLTFHESFLFPIESVEGRRDVFIGGLVVILLLPIGWIMNLGARLDVVHRLFTGDPGRIFEECGHGGIRFVEGAWRQLRYFVTYCRQIFALALVSC